MFRRKEESLFDAPTESAYAPSAPAETTTAIQPPAAPAANSGAGSTSGSSSASGSASSSSGGVSRPLPDSRPSQSGTAFRPNASSIGADMSRNRMPEAKTTTVTSSNALIDKSNKSGRRVLTVGNDILLKGEIATCDRLVIEGKVDATLNDVHTVEIAETGSFKGSAQIEDAEISGLFEGDLIVRNRLVIYSTGKVRGKITYGEIEIERGGELTGEIKTVTNSGQSSNSRPTTRPAMKDDKVAA